MKKQLILFVFFVSLFTLDSFAQGTVRTDGIWARSIGSATITLDGVFSEPEWALAEQLVIKYGQDAGLPTSGWRAEFQPDAVTDPTDAIVKFLVKDNQLYLAFSVKDSSVGGTQDWARWDAILMSVKDKLSSDRPAPAVEYFYTYWLSGLANPNPVVGAPPRFVGRYGNFNDTIRTPEQVAAWDARTKIHGISNDNLRDTGWDVEMRVDLGVLGYDITKPEGDIIMLNFSIWDCDYLFEGDPMKISSTRTHWQSPWGNANSNNVGRIYARPDITTITSLLPVVESDFVIRNGASFPDITIDGSLSDAVWQQAPGINLAYGDTILRASYTGVAPYQSGQFQPELNGNPRPPVLDPSVGSFKMFFKGKYLYLGADITDQVVQGTEIYDKVDGLALILGHRQVVNAENAMEFKVLRANYNFTGVAQAYDYLPSLVDSGKAEFAFRLKGNTTINNNTDVDSGYTVEMKIDLTGLGYPENLGDKLLFAGLMLADGDSFDDTLSNYGTRVWWYREHSGGPAVAWMVIDPQSLVNVEDSKEEIAIPNGIEILGNYPNPFNPETKIKYNVSDYGNVTLLVYNTIGQLVKSINKENVKAGLNEFSLNASNLSSGVYFYKIVFRNDKNSFESASQKMIYLK